MASNEIELLVTCWSSVEHLVVSASDFSVVSQRTVHSGHGIYFGVTYTEETLHVLARGYDLDKRNRILSFDKMLAQTDDIDISASVKEGHQIQRVGSEIYIANTSHNCISVLNLETKEIRHIFPLPNRQGKNFNHINSLYVQGSTLRFAAANRFRNSFFVEYDLDENRVLDIDALGLSVHNIVPTPHGLITCDSFHGAVVIWNTGFDAAGIEQGLASMHLLPDLHEVRNNYIDLARANFREQRGNPIFPRGLAVSGELLAVGLSDNNKRSLRQQSPSRVMLIDGLEACSKGAAPKRVKTIDFGSFGAVMDVRILGQADYGHPLPPDGAFTAVR